MLVTCPFSDFHTPSVFASHFQGIAGIAWAWYRKASKWAHHVVEAWFGICSKSMIPWGWTPKPWWGRSPCFSIAVSKEKSLQPRLHLHLVSTGKMSRYNSEKNRKQGTEFANHFLYIDCMANHKSVAWNFLAYPNLDQQKTNAKALMKKCTNYKLQAPLARFAKYMYLKIMENPTRFSLIKHHETATSSIEEVFLPWPPIFCHTQIVWPVAVDKKWHSHVFSGPTLSRDT